MTMPNNHPKFAIAPDALGHYRYSAMTGLVTTVAARDATHGFLWAHRHSSAVSLAVVDYIRIRYAPKVPFTAAQELQFRLFKASSFSVNFASGTAIVGTNGSFRKDTRHNVSLLGDARIATTGELTVGTMTLDTQEILGLQYNQPGATATLVSTYPVEEEFIARGPNAHPIILAANEGLVLGNEILMGAGGTGRLLVEIEWQEVPLGSF